MGINKERIQVLLDPETIKSLNKEAKEKSISVSAVIRQKVEASYKSTETILFSPEEIKVIVQKSRERR